MNGAVWTALALVETAAVAGLAIQARAWRRALRRLESGSAVPLRPRAEPAPAQGTTVCWILVAARDEASHVHALFQALAPARQAGARLVWVDDGSGDDGPARVRGLLGTDLWEDSCLLEQAATGKPAALATGLEWILRRAAVDDPVLFTDADARPRPGWLAAHREALREAGMACGRVLLDLDGGTEGQRRRRRFESAVSDLQCALGCASGAPRYARGANWSARAGALRRVDAPAILRRVRSGDDVHVVRALAEAGISSVYLTDPAAAVATGEELRPAAVARSARRRYGKVRDLPAREILRQAGLMGALLLQPLLLAAGLGGAWPLALLPALTMGGLAWAAHDTLVRGLRLLGEERLAQRPLGAALGLGLHALRHGLRGALLGYTWRQRPGKPGRERTP
jgi:hypothetical protein